MKVRQREWRELFRAFDDIYGDGKGGLRWGE